MKFSAEFIGNFQKSSTLHHFCDTKSHYFFDEQKQAEYFREYNKDKNAHRLVGFSETLRLFRFSNAQM